MNKDKVSKVLKMIAQDTKDDAKKFDGQPFNGRTVAEYLGNHDAAIATLAEIVKLLLESLPPTTEEATSEQKMIDALNENVSALASAGAFSARKDSGK